ncbi:MAG: OmpA-like transrane domain [Burkholderiales bacterium]|jgi:hypothetical protein|nr:OmpA-like transrane domain [Burkholderiales bacterium]
MRKLLFILAITANWCYAEGGFYAGLGAGYAYINNIPQSGFSFNNGSSSSQSVGSFATTIYAGYDFNNIVGLQIDYDVAYNGLPPSYSQGQQVTDGALILHLPFSIISASLKDFSLFAKGGIGYNYYSFGNISPNCATCVNPPNNISAFVPVYGLGAEYDFNSFAVRAQWNYNGSVTAANEGNDQLQLNSNMYLLSVLYRF